MTSQWIHPVNDGSMGIAYRLLDEPEPNERVSDLRNETCHVFHDHADGNRATLFRRLLGTRDRVIRMVTHRALELRRPGGPLAPDAKQP